ncbi:MAG: AIR carboxylase family protein [Microthrixaceae bacterium]
MQIMGDSAVRVGVIMGSSSDADVMADAARALDEFGVGHEVRVVNCPAARREWSTTPPRRGIGGSR